MSEFAFLACVEHVSLARTRLCGGLIDPIPMTKHSFPFLWASV